MKIRRMLPGCQLATACGEAPAAAGTGVTGWPLLITAAAGTVRDPAPNSRRLTANPAHAKGAETGEPSPLPAPSQVTTSEPTVSPEPAAARGAAVLTGSGATAAVEASATTGSCTPLTFTGSPAGTVAAPATDTVGPDENCPGRESIIAGNEASDPARSE